MVPKEATRAAVEEELEGARAWAKRHDVALTWLPDRLEIRALLVQPETGSEFYLKGDVKGYKVVPPAWAFCTPQWEESTSLEHFPARVKTPFGSSIFHAKPVICAPFNRLAYKEHGGPHSDWGGPAQWLDAAKNKVRATTIGDMLQAIRRDFLYTRGSMA